MKKIICLLMCLAVVVSALVSCSKPPELAEIMPRLEELVEASYGVNRIMFGTGLETYERVYDPIESLKYYEDSETDRRYYYYMIEDRELGDVLAYRTRSYGDDFEYLLVTNEAGEDCVYHDEKAGLYYNKLTDYVEKEYEFYYNSSIPDGYDVVRADEVCVTIEKIKEYAEKVYSKDYLESVYEALFDGAMVSSSSSGLLTARYTEYTDDYGFTWLLKSNSYEPLVTEKRIYDVSSATLERSSNAQYVRVTMQTYLEDSPNEKLAVTVALVLVDGIWYLDSGTY